MTYILLHSNTSLSCETNKMVLTQEQVKHIDSIDKLLLEVTRLKDYEQQRVSEAESEGFRKGYTEGLRKSLDEAKAQFTDYINSTAASVIEKHVLSEKAIIDLAVNITQKVANDIGSDEMIVGIVKRAVKNLKKERSLEIRVNSELAESVKQKLQTLLIPQGKLTSNIEFIPDPTLGELDCIITSDSGVTEASFEKQMQQLKQQLYLLTQNPKLNP